LLEPSASATAAADEAGCEAVEGFAVVVEDQSGDADPERAVGKLADC